MKISIIMPIYNAEKTVRRMLESIKAQTLEDFEVIMIDDGSTDLSRTICDEYTKTDSRFKVIHKQNGGVSIARQTGMDEAKGDYVIHADADDWMDCVMLEELYNVAINKDADVVICDFFSNTRNEETYVKQKPTTLLAQDILRDLSQRLHGACWNKLVKRKCYKKLNARFFPDINYCEDLLFWMQIYSHLDVKTAYLNRAFYHYYVDTTHQSIMSSYSYKFFEMSCQVIDMMEEIIPTLILFKQEIIDRQKMNVKCGAFEHPIFTPNEYYAIYPEVNNKIMGESMSFINRLLLYLSYHGFYKSATSLYKIKNMMTGHHVR